MKEVILVVVMLSTSPSGVPVRERHEYRFPDLAACEKAKAKVMADWHVATVGWTPQGIMAWCRQ